VDSFVQKKALKISEALDENTEYTNFGRKQNLKTLSEF
jgi:hypothetical protein